MKRGAANNGTEKYKIRLLIIIFSVTISPAASRLASRENILPNSAFVTHFDNIDLIMMEENAERNPLTEPANSTHPDVKNVNLVVFETSMVLTIPRNTHDDKTDDFGACGKDTNSCIRHLQIEADNGHDKEGCNC